MKRAGIDFMKSGRVDNQGSDGLFIREFKDGALSLGGFKLVKKTFSATSSLFDAAATTDTAELLAATAARVVLIAKLVLRTQFTLPGDRTGLTVTLGEDGGDVDDIVVAGAMNLSSDAVGTEYKARGAVWDAQGESIGILNRVIDLTATLSGGATGNHDDMSVGSLDAYLVTLDW